MWLWIEMCGVKVTSAAQNQWWLGETDITNKHQNPNLIIFAFIYLLYNILIKFKVYKSCKYTARSI